MSAPTAPAYGYLHSARVHSVDEVTGAVYLLGLSLAPTSRWGPVASCVFGLQPGDRVVAATLGLSRDNLIIVGKVGDRLPDIGDIPGLVEALDGKADDSQITAINGELDDHEDRLDGLDSAVAANTAAIATKVSTSVVGQPDGVASLDASGDVPLAQMHAGVELTSRKNQASGYAGLDGSSKLTGSQLPYAAVGTIAAVGVTSAAGSSDTAPRGDHVHALPSTVRRTIHLVQREDNASIAVTSGTARSTIHTVALTGLTPETIYQVDVKVPSFCSVTGAKMRISLHKGSSANPTLDDSTPEVQSIGGDEVHALRLTYNYKTLAAETAVTFVVSGYRYAGTGTVTFFAFNGMPYTFEVSQVGTSFNAF